MKKFFTRLLIRIAIVTCENTYAAAHLKAALDWENK